MINKRLLSKQINDQIFNSTKVKKHFDDSIFKYFERCKKEMLKEFDTHPITRDLQGSIDSGLVSKGSLFGFLGFQQGEDPTQELRDVLTKCSIRYLKIKHKQPTRIYRAEIPDKDTIYSATPLRWAPGRSWVKAIEFGISGIGAYIDLDNSKSRSGEGFQSKTSDTGGSFKKSGYVSDILSNFQKKISAKGIKIG